MNTIPRHNGPTGLPNTIETWLTELGLPQYAGVFAENGIDPEVIGELTTDHLKEMGIAVLGHRLKIAKAIAELKPVAELPTDALSNVAQAERRHLTIMFCDLVGSTALSARLDPEDYRDVMTSYQEAVSQVVTGAGGHVAKYLGDGVLIYFGYPIAQEDAAERACRAGLEIIEAIAGLKTLATDALKVRIGVATGIVVVGDLFGDGVEEVSAVAGETPNLAARLQGLAQPGQIVIGDKTHALLGEMFVYDKLPDVHLKGFEADQTAWRVTGEAESAERFTVAPGRERLSPLVGRDAELEQVLTAWDATKAGAGQVVMVSGEAGIGKSRLAHEVLVQAKADGATILHYQSAPYYGNTAFHPIRRQIEGILQLGSEKDDDSRLTKLEKLVMTDGDVMESYALMASLLGLPLDRYPPLNLSPALQKSRTIDVLIEQTVQLARKTPVIVHFEDLHWIDPSSMELLTRFVSALRQHPIMMLATARPEFTHAWEGNHIHHSELSRLSKSQLKELLVSLTKGTKLTEEQRKKLYERSDGVPLFAEELVRFVQEDGAGEGDVPDSLQDSLMARLDKLGHSRDLALIGATIGREFDAALLGYVSGLDTDTITRQMADLERSDLVNPSRARESWVFSHALLQEAAYRSMLRSPRQELHRRIAETLETHFPDRCELGPEQVANHFTSAGEGARAVPYWLTAGKTAWARASMKEALAHLGRGLEYVGDVTDTHDRAKLELQLQSTLGVVHFAATSYASSQAQEAFERCRELFAEVNDRDLRIAVLYGIGAFETMRGDIISGHRTFGALAEDVALSGNARYEVYSESMLAWSHYNRGNFSEVVHHANRVLELYEAGVWDEPGPRLSAADPKAISECFRAAALWSLGFPDQAVQVGNDLLDYAGTLPDPYSQVYALANGVIRMHDWVGNWNAIVPLTEKCNQIGIEYGYGFLGLWSSVWQARAMAQNGDLEAAEEITSKTVEGFKAVGVRYHSVCFEAGHARLFLMMDRVDDAAALVETLAEPLEKGGEFAHKVDLDLVRGEVARAQGSPEAEAHFRAAMKTAQDQNALSWELRAALALSDYVPDRAALLEPLLARFEEGFDTHDLKAARALISA